MKCWDKVLENDPENVVAWKLRGVNLVSLSRFEEALACFVRLLEVNPRDADAWGLKAGVLRCLGRFEDASWCQVEATFS